MYIGQDFIEMVKSFYPSVKVASGGAEVVVRCPFCGDSKNINHAHMYISVPQSDDKVSQYHCKKCQATGVVNDELLRLLGCNDLNTLVEVNRQNDSVNKRIRHYKIKGTNIYNFNISSVTYRQENEFKIAYINNRIGAFWSIQELINLKICLNLYDIIVPNDLKLTRDQRIVDALAYNFIGFISHDNSSITLRKVNDGKLPKTIDKRYINYNLISGSKHYNYYVIPTIVDTRKLCRIHVAEGAFDVLGIYHNLYNDAYLNEIYIACGGTSYTQALKYILENLKLVLYEVHFYPDYDVSDDHFNDLISNIKDLPCDIYVHRNGMGKDYGVNKSQIYDRIVYRRNI